MVRSTLIGVTMLSRIACSEAFNIISVSGDRLRHVCTAITLSAVRSRHVDHSSSPTYIVWIRPAERPHDEPSNEQMYVIMYPFFPVLFGTWKYLSSAPMLNLKELGTISFGGTLKIRRIWSSS